MVVWTHSARPCRPCQYSIERIIPALVLVLILEGISIQVETVSLLGGKEPTNI